MNKRLIAGAVTLAGLALLAGTPQVPGAISTRWFAGNLYEGVIGYTQWALVGTTSTTHLGDAGVRTTNDDCRAEFPMSRTCTSVEVMESVPSYAFSSAEAAWVRPVLAGTSDGKVFDASLKGVNSTTIAESNLSCDGWSDRTGIALAVDEAGGFEVLTCSTPRPVACCALIQVPEPSQNSGLVMGIAALSLLGQRRERRRGPVGYGA